LFIVVIGGTARIEGPFIGTIIFFVLRALFADYGPLYLVILGVVAVMAMLFAPSGAWGVISRRTRFEAFSLKRALPPINQTPPTSATQSSE
jgi:branched-chain amino acid transport system permease protein